jgi:hypothetical protein
MLARTLLPTALASVPSGLYKFEFEFWPLLLRQKRPMEFALLIYVSQQDRAVCLSDQILRKLQEVLYYVLKYLAGSSRMKFKCSNVTFVSIS